MRTTFSSNLAAPKTAAQRVRIEFHDDQAETVFIAGTFNDWHPAISPMIALGGGRWVKELCLPPGRYEYLLVVDGLWTFDPKARDYAPNVFGTMNSVLDVPSAGESPQRPELSDTSCGAAHWEAGSRRVSPCGVQPPNPWECQHPISEVGKKTINQKKDRKMKTTFNVEKRLVKFASITLLALAWLPVQTQAADCLKGGQILMQWHQLAPKVQTEWDRANKVIPMSCAKCKSVAVTRVTLEKGHVKTSIVSEKHLCPGCQTSIVVTGFGKGKKLVPVHVCKNCGDDSLYCCATTTGSKPTRGMEKN
ncbi:MAG: glycogen-binding domain-containing protein [Verrucomicrobiota bacterium]